MIHITLSILIIFLITMSGCEETKKMKLVERLSKLETTTIEPQLPEGVYLNDSSDIEFDISEYEKCKIIFMEIYDLTDLQFDVLWGNYLGEKRNAKFITNGVNLYFKHGTAHKNLQMVF